MLNKVGAQLKILATAATAERLLIKAADQDAEKILEPVRSDFIYFRARAISAGDQGPIKGEANPNGNGDYFPRAELEKSYETFIGRNLFLNHESDHPVKSVGKIIDAYKVDDPETGEFYIECLSKIDKRLHSDIARKVETGELNTVSMGCSCMESMCSVCGCTIHSDADARCEHMAPGRLLQEFEASIDLPEYGITKGQRVKAFCINKGLAFNELSIVNVPADSRAFIKTIIANVRAELTKKASLDKNEQAELLNHIEGILSQLDETTRDQVKAEFCSSPTCKAAVAEEEESVDAILKRISAFQYMRLLEHTEKKAQKYEAAKATEQTEEKAMNKIFEKAMKTLAGKVFSKAVERIATEEEVIEKEAKTRCALCAIDFPDWPTYNAHMQEKHKQGVPAKPVVEEKKAALEKCTLCNKECEKCEGGMCPDCILRRKHEKKATFERAEDLAKSAWTLMEGDTVILKATLSDIWGDELESQEDWATAEEYGNNLIAYYAENGLEKTAELLGINKKAEESVDKAVEESKEEVKEEAAEAVVGDHLEQAKPEEDQKKEAKVIEASAFDKVEKIMLEQGHYAIKDKETKEVVIFDAEGKEAKRLPDGFGDDIPTVMKLLHAVLGLKEKVEEKPVEETKAEKPAEEVKEEPKQEEKVEEVKEEKVDEKEAACTKAALEKCTLCNKECEKCEGGMCPDCILRRKHEKEASEKQAALEAREKAVKAREEQLRVQTLGEAIKAKAEKCGLIVRAMLDKDLLDITIDDLEESFEPGMALLDARKLAFEKVSKRQLTALLAMDDNSLEAFAKSITGVKKEASAQPVKRAFSLQLPESHGEEDDIKSIFSSMGTLKGK